MDLNELHRKLSKDASCVVAYEELGDVVELTLHCRKVREERGITQAELATEAGVTTSAISRFEALKDAEGWVISAIVRHLEPWLRRRDVAIERWVVDAPEGRGVGHRAAQRTLASRVRETPGAVKPGE